MHYILYKTTNLINNKIYIGIHKQKQEPFCFDGYMGSGFLLKRAIDKYGIENFNRETLEVLPTWQDARKRESEVVNLAFLIRDDVYNIALGGGRGNSRPFIVSELKKSVKRKMYKKNGKSLFVLTQEQLDGYRIRAEKRIIEHPHTLPNNKGRIHSGAALENMREGFRKRRGKYIRITDGNKAVTHLAESPIPDGWRKGESPNKKRFVCHKQEAREKISKNPKISGVVCYTNI